MKIIRTVSELKKLLIENKALGTVGLVPTMGALHSGHIALVEQCRRENKTCVVSIFVNPTQFNDANDLKNYPRTEHADCVLLESAGCDYVFAPSAEEMYPEQDTRIFTFGGIESVMEGPNRPGHFNGVAQIVSKLFYIVEPNRAYFGEKDFQQLAIIRRMTRDLSLDIEIIGCSIVRAEDGLALSSRNMLLSEEHRAVAPHIYAVLSESVDKQNSMSVADVQNWVIDKINESSAMEVEYYSICNALTLQPAVDWNEKEGVQGCVTVRIGGIRLIDNIKYS